MHNVKVSKGHQVLGLHFLSENQFWEKGGEGKQRESEDRSGEHLAEISTFMVKSLFDVFQFKVTASGYPAPAALLIWGLLQTVMCSLESKLSFRKVMSAALLVCQDIAFTM